MYIRQSPTWHSSSTVSWQDFVWKFWDKKKNEIQASHRNGIPLSFSKIYIFKIKITIINISKITIAVILQIHFIKEINKYDKIQLLSIMVHFCRSRCNRRCIDGCSPFFILKWWRDCYFCTHKIKILCIFGIFVHQW